MYKVQSWYYNNLNNDFKEIQLNEKIKETTSFFKNNPDLIITNADKSNKTCYCNKKRL